MRLEKETSVFKKNALATAITNAVGRATKFVAELANGIFVHAEGTPSDPTDSDAVGVYITDKVDIIKDGDSVASYGDTTTIGKESSKHIHISQDSILFNNGADRIAGMYSSDETISPSGTNIRVIGTDFALSGEYDTANKEWETPQYAVITGQRRIYPTYIAGCEQLEVASKNEQDPDRSSRTRISLHADDDQTGSIFMELSTGEDESDEDFVSKSFIMSLSSAASSIVTNIDNIYIYDEDSGNRIEFGSGNITSAGFAIPCVLPYTFSNQTAAASTRGTLQNLSVPSLPSSATVLAVCVTSTPNRHWIWASAYANSDNTIGINYVNEYNEAISGNFTVLIFFTL